MKISNDLSDQAILTEIGTRIAQRRLELQLTQAEVAEQAGIAKRTVERVESGGSSQMSSLIRIFRTLDLLSGLEVFIPESGPRPLELLKHKGKLRQRASKSRRKTEAMAGSRKPWIWGEDK